MTDALTKIEGISLNKIPQIWVVYSHAVMMPDASMNRCYFGVCRLGDLFRFPDALRNSEWAKVVKEARTVDIEIWAYFETERDAVNHRFLLLRGFQPHCNLRGYDQTRRSKIVCLESGLEFETQTAACEHYRVTQSAMSNHLAGKPGFKTVGGYTFERRND